MVFSCSANFQGRGFVAMVSFDLPLKVTFVVVVHGVLKVLLSPSYG